MFGTILMGGLTQTCQTITRATAANWRDGRKMTSNKSHKARPKLTKKPKRLGSPLRISGESLSERYREVQWLRDLVKHFERLERKSSR